MARGPGGIEITVLEEDGLTYSRGVLVLKHAQALYGLDEKVVNRTGVDAEALPLPDGFRTFSDLPGIGAKTVLFVGTRAIREFSYPDIRKFAYKALCSVASAEPQASEIALTLHGVGYGLDEVECFEAEVGGILDAIASEDIPRGLETVTFLEVNHGRAKRMRDALPSLLDPKTADPAAGASNGASKRAHAFVAMPFDKAFSDLFHYGFSSAVRASGLLCERIDQQGFTGDVLQRMKDQIRTAKLVVADLTGGNANVFLEVGFAWGNEVPTVLVCADGTKAKFDVQGQKTVYYKSIMDLEEKLKTELRDVLAGL
jgi:hypothetical protein